MRAVSDLSDHNATRELQATPAHGGAAGEVSQTVEHLFRQEAGKIVAILTGIFGVEHLGLAEDVVQEALARALQTWPYHGVPQKPAAWIMRAAKNLALDVIRRKKNFRQKEPEIIRLLDQPGAYPDAATFAESEVVDDRLRLMFVCCHPSIPVEAQVALALKTLGGFSIAEICRAFFSTEAAIAKRLTRARQKIREERIPFEIPAGEELAQRLEAVLQTLYLLFNEGYKASSGDKLVREDICAEAIRLAQLLSKHPAGDRPATHALVALMLFNAARTLARVDDQGNLLRLQEQDRGSWNQAMIARGMYHFSRSAAGAQLTEYHLQAGIAACHCSAQNYESTDWIQILALYDRLIELNCSAVVRLNRAVAVANVQGPEAGLAALDEIADGDELRSYHLLYAVLAELEHRRGNFAAAAERYGQALKLTDLEIERSFLLKRLQACQDLAVNRDR